MSTAETRINHWSPDGEAPEWLYRFDQTVPKLDGWDAVTDGL